MNWKQASISLIRRYAAVPVFLFCVFALYLFLRIGYLSVVGPVLGGIAGGLIAIFALVILDTPTGSHSSSKRTPVDYRIAGIFAALYVTSIFVLYRFVSYERPWAHYLIFGAYAGFVAYEIVTNASRKRVVAELLVLAFFTYWSTQFAFPAGMYGPDTKYRYVPAVQYALDTGFVSLSQLIYLGHLTYVTLATVLMGVPAELGYYLLSVLVLTGTLLIISVVDISLPAISDRVALYAALVFGCMSWTLGRGFHPNKLNFFYPLILLVGLATLGMFVHRQRGRWLAIAAIVSPALIFGHQFSAGAALIFLLVIAGFIVVATTGLQTEYRVAATGLPLSFVAAYALAIFGNPIHQGPLLGRITGLFLSILAPVSSSGGGPGRYSQIPLDMLLINTSSQAVVFALAVFGAAIALRKSNWELDFGITWMGALAAFLLVSLMFNSADTQPQRFYSLLGLFGLNIFAGVTLFYLQNRRRGREFGLATKAIPVIIAGFCILSLVSPVAGMHLSPYGDQIPHFKKFDRSESVAGSDWVESNVPEEPNVPYSVMGPSTATINRSALNHGSIYFYDDISRRTGVATEGGLSLGGRQFSFLVFNESHVDDTIYSNGGYRVYMRH